MTRFQLKDLWRLLSPHHEQGIKARTQADTKVLISFGAVDGGFEFAMQLRLDIYRRFNKNPQAEPFYCYLDAESLRNNAATTYTYDQETDKNMMENPDWKNHYGSAMDSCRTMILLMTKQWLTSKWCWGELDMLISRAAVNRDMKVLCVWWPDADALMKTGFWKERQAGGVNRDRIELQERLYKLPNQQSFSVSGNNPLTGGRLTPIIGAVTGGVENQYRYSCTEDECKLLLAAIDG